MRIWVDRRGDIRELRLEHSPRVSEQMHLDCLAEAHRRAIPLAHISQEPDLRHIADREDWNGGTTCGAPYVLAKTNLTLGHRAGNWRVDHRLRIHAEPIGRVLDRGDLGIALAENA